MAQLLVNVLSVSLPAGGSVVLAHGLESGGVGVVPTQVIADRTTPIACSNATTTNVAFINSSAEAAVANFRCEYDHSIHATGATPIRYQGLDASISGAVSYVDLLLWGNGSDGAVTLTAAGATPLPYATRTGATWTLTREVYATNFTVEAGVTVDTQGKAVWCTGTFTNNGTHGVYGTSGVGQLGGAGLQGSFGFSNNGPSGASGTNNGNPPTGGSNNAMATTSTPGGGAGARTGGSGTSNFAGVSVPFPTYTTPWFAITRFVRNNYVVGSTGGGGGASDVTAGGTATGGGGAGGLPVHAIIARAFNNLGTVESRGGNGGNAATTGAGIAGGGGASNGGGIYILTSNLVATGTIQSVGGTGGAGANGGLAGTNGAAGPTFLITV